MTAEKLYPSNDWRCDKCGGDKVRHGPYCSASAIGAPDPEDSLKAELLAVLDDRDKLRAHLDEATRRANWLDYFLRIFIHAHGSGNSVPPHLEEEARAALSRGER